MKSLRTNRNKVSTAGAAPDLAESPAERGRAGGIMSKILAAGFLFFFIKGLVWLAIGGAAVVGAVKASG